MSETPDTLTQQQHRAVLRQAYHKNPENETLRKALAKSMRPKYIQQAARKGVFICYAMTDGVFALNLALSLREAGIRAFLDELEADDSMDWGETVNQALRDCAVLVLVLSPHGIEDGEVIGEYSYFMRTGKIIVPVIAENCILNGFETVIEPINFVLDYDAALAQLKTLLTLDNKVSA